MINFRRIAVVLLLATALAGSASAQIDISISANIAPPALPVYVKPICPADGYIWTPGYWAYDNVDGYYWVAGSWVLPPQNGYLWTPCYWGYTGGIYGFHQGYWGSHVGFYGGVNYGYGYGGSGYGGGRWEGNSFKYNTAVSNVNRSVIHNTYVNNSVVNNRGGRSSFNGQGGTTARPSPQERSAMQEHHAQPTIAQVGHQQTAGKDRSQFANTNHVAPANTIRGNAGRAYNTSPAQQHQQAAQNNNLPRKQSRQAPQQFISNHNNRHTSNLRSKGNNSHNNIISNPSSHILKVAVNMAIDKYRITGA